MYVMYVCCVCVGSEYYVEVDPLSLRKDPRYGQKHVKHIPERFGLVLFK